MNLAFSFLDYNHIPLQLHLHFLWESILLCQMPTNSSRHKVFLSIPFLATFMSEKFLQFCLLHKLLGLSSSKCYS